MTLSTEFTNAIAKDFELGSESFMGQVESVSIINGLSISVKFFDNTHDYGFMYDIVGGFFLQVN